MDLKFKLIGLLFTAMIFLTSAAIAIAPLPVVVVKR